MTWWIVMAALWGVIAILGVVTGYNDVMTAMAGILMFLCLGVAEILHELAALTSGDGT